MPIYEFQCKACGQESEVLVRSSDWKGTPCPKCGSRKLMKKLSVFAAGPASTPAAGGGSCLPCGMPAGGGGGCCGGGSCGLGPN